MKNLWLSLFLIFSISFVFSGCSSGYPVTYATQPAGAKLICSGQVKGTTPKRLYYELNEQNKAYGQLNTVPCRAQWMSGSSKNYSSSWDINKFPNGVQQTLQSDNYSQDVQYELQLRRTQAAERAAEAAEDAASAQKQQANQQFYDSLKPKMYNVTPNYMGGYNIMQY